MQKAWPPCKNVGLDRCAGGAVLRQAVRRFLWFVATRRDSKPGTPAGQSGICSGAACTVAEIASRKINA
jgi:hypothetical protein